MTLTETICDIVKDVIRNMMQMSIERIHSNGKETLAITHVGGAKIELKNDGFVYINGTKWEAVSGADHSALTNLTWSTAGHTMDSNLNMLNNDINNIMNMYANYASLTTAGIGSLGMTGNIDMNTHGITECNNLSHTGVIGINGTQVNIQSGGSTKLDINSTDVELHTSLDMGLNDITNGRNVTIDGELNLSTTVDNGKIECDLADFRIHSKNLKTEIRGKDNVQIMTYDALDVGQLSFDFRPLGTASHKSYNAIDMNTNGFHNVGFVNSVSYLVGKTISTGDHSDQVWLLCAAVGGDNECIGKFINQRNSGHYDAIDLDVTISTPSTGTTVYGFIGCNHQIASDTSNAFTLVKCTYGGSDYVALRYIGDQYSFTNPMVFTGFFKSTLGNNFLNLATTSVTSVSDLSNVQTKTTFNADKVGIGITNPTHTLHVDGTCQVGACDITGNLDMNSNDITRVDSFTATSGNFGSLWLTGNIDMGLNDILNVGKLFTPSIETGSSYLNVSGDTSSGITLSPSGNCQMQYDSSTLRTYVPSSGQYKWFVNNIIRLTLDDTKLDVYNNTDLKMSGGDLYMEGGVIDDAFIWGTQAIEFMIDKDNTPSSTTTALLFNHDGNRDHLGALTWDKTLQAFGLTQGTSTWTDLYLGGLAVNSGIDMQTNPITDCGDISINSGKKLYLYNTGTDSTSMYITRNSTSGNMIFHVPSGKSVEWQVG